MKGLTLAFLLILSLADTQTGFVGKWNTIDDESGEARSVVELYER
jgi:hypothetical protein